MQPLETITINPLTSGEWIKVETAVFNKKTAVGDDVNKLGLIINDHKCPKLWAQVATVNEKGEPQLPLYHQGSLVKYLRDGGKISGLVGKWIRITAATAVLKMYEGKTYTAYIYNAELSEKKPA